MSITSISIVGAMVELVDTPVLGTGLARGEGSSPFRPTKKYYESNCRKYKRIK